MCMAHRRPLCSHICVPFVHTCAPQVLVYDEVKKDVTDAMLSIVNDERDGKDINRGLIKCCVELFEAMGMGSLEQYNSDFEEPLLQATREFYGRRRESWIEKDSTPDFLIKAEKSLEEASCRARKRGEKDGSVMIYKVPWSGYYHATGRIGDQRYA